MAESKVFHPQGFLQSLTPYEHALQCKRSACPHDCPARRWLQRTSDAPWSDAVLNSDADDSRYVALALRLYFENLGAIEGSFADLGAEAQSAVLQVAQRIKTEIGTRRG